MLGLFLLFLFAFIPLSLITHIYYSFLFLHPTLSLTCGPGSFALFLPAVRWGSSR